MGINRGGTGLLVWGLTEGSVGINRGGTGLLVWGE